MLIIIGLGRLKSCTSRRGIYSCLCKVCSHVSEALLLTLWTLSLSFLTNNPSSDCKAFLRFILFSGSPTAVHRAFLFFDVKAWPVTNWPSRALRYYTVGIPFWTSHKRQSQMSKFNRKTTIPRAPSHMIIMYVVWRGTRKQCTEENGWLSHGKFITFLTFELRSFR